MRKEAKRKEFRKRNQKQVHADKAYIQGYLAHKQVLAALSKPAVVS